MAHALPSRNLQSGRVVLRGMEQSDYILFEQFDEEVLRQLDVQLSPWTESKRRAWFERELRGRLNDEYRWMCVNQQGELIVTIETSSCNRGFGTFKYGIALAREYWGQGYAAEMILLVLKHYFLELGYKKVTPHVYASNAQSIKLHEKLGFQQEGRLRNMVVIDGVHVDEIHYGMTREEYIEKYMHS